MGQNDDIEIILDAPLPSRPRVTNGNDIDNDSDDAPSLSDQIASCVDDMDFASLLKTSAKSKRRLTSADRGALAGELLRRAPRMSPSAAAMVLWALGTLREASMPIRSTDMLAIIDLLLERLEGARDHLSGLDLMQALVGLARLGIRFPTPHSALPFLDPLPRHLPQMDEVQVSATVWAMGKVRVQGWTILSSRIALMTPPSPCHRRRA